MQPLHDHLGTAGLDGPVVFHGGQRGVVVHHQCSQVCFHLVLHREGFLRPATGTAATLPTFVTVVTFGPAAAFVLFFNARQIDIFSVLLVAKLRSLATFFGTQTAAVKLLFFILLVLALFAVFASTVSPSFYTATAAAAARAPGTDSCFLALLAQHLLAGLASAAGPALRGSAGSILSIIQHSLGDLFFLIGVKQIIVVFRLIFCFTLLIFFFFLAFFSLFLNFTVTLQGNHFATAGLSCCWLRRRGGLAAGSTSRGYFLLFFFALLAGFIFGTLSLTLTLGGLGSRSGGCSGGASLLAHAL
mmetsp:Transcript_39388/g.68242  ORF Transcript_39388/g.68242 Transcript_39388/m.68242 type:complete len:302 (+) Transcript_39388:1285-2190(+)